MMFICWPETRVAMPPEPLFDFDTFTATPEPDAEVPVEVLAEEVLPLPVEVLAGLDGSVVVPEVRVIRSDKRDRRAHV